MFVSDDFVFLHLQKSAGTYVIDRLAQVLPGAVTGGHAPLRAGPRGRVVAAAIRDPWDWYVSLWSYGCMGEGEVRGRLTAPHGRILRQTVRATLARRLGPRAAWARLRTEHERNPAFWCDLYASADDPERFRRWLRAVMTLPGCRHLPDRYPLLPLRGQVGFMTFRVLGLFTDWSAWHAGAHRIHGPADALDFYRRHCIVNHVLRTERAEADLEALLGSLGIAAPAVEQAQAPARSNRSKRCRHADYYDADTIALVAEKDRMVVELFGYTPPEPAA
ncbi:hypothetical protein [Histidinibacterium lentulum]|uniref:Sulfotransferase family protein n=1 Tax=Histidinibacterium lentulum TaxID=2480588 RepID=A0A3N2QVB7_9RHOB|nr:hypothetical protein [Histidinibacterium lentulum]ROT99097.1 hypothetical protein EAT49_15905 [Histidinibacterium lentulum]